MLTIIYIQAPYIYICRFNNYTAHSSYRILVMTTGVMGVMEMGNIVPRAGFEPTPLAFCHHSTHVYLSMWLFT